MDDYDALLLPGGTVNPDKLRVDESAMAFVREFVESGKPVAAICHGPWSLLEAGVVSSDRDIVPQHPHGPEQCRRDVVDEEVATDGNLITSRSPDDLDAFSGALVSAIGNA